MNKEFILKRYLITFFENGFEMTLKATAKRETILDVALHSTVMLALLAFSAFCFVKSGYFYAVTFFISFLLVSVIYVFKTVVGKKREKVFLFRVDETGITHIDVNARYYIEWNDVVSFGFVNGNMMSLSHVQSEGLQMCLYFAKEEYNERYFRKKLDKIPLSRTYMHASTEKMIVLGFLQNELEEDLYGEIYSCICQYIDKSKEHSFIMQPDF